MLVMNVYIFSANLSSYDCSRHWAKHVESHIKRKTTHKGDYQENNNIKPHDRAYEFIDKRPADINKTSASTAPIMGSTKIDYYDPYNAASI